MSVRLPLQTVLSYSGSSSTGPASTAGGVAKPFTIPQDTDNVIVQFTASILAGGASAVLQTSNDGGTTWWDVARTSIVSNANSTVTSEWLNGSTTGPGIATGATTNYSNSVVGAAIGQAGASTLGSRQVSGLPIMGTYNRVFLRYTAAVTSIISEAVTVYVNSQSPRA